MNFVDVKAFSKCLNSILMAAGSWARGPSQALTILNGAVGQEVLDGVCVDQPQAPALSRHAVLRLLLLRPGCGLLQLHLGAGGRWGCSGQVP